MTSQSIIVSIVMARDGTNAAEVFATVADFKTDHGIEEPKGFTPLVKRPPFEA